MAGFKIIITATCSRCGEEAEVDGPGTWNFSELRWNPSLPKGWSMLVSGGDLRTFLCPKHRIMVLESDGVYTSL